MKARVISVLAGKIVFLLIFSLLGFQTGGVYFSEDYTARRVRLFSIEEYKRQLITNPGLATVLLNFLAQTNRFDDTQIGADNFSKKDFGEYNPVMLILGSPSPQTFVNAAKRWQKYQKWWEEARNTGYVPIIISTGRGRGYKSLVIRALNYAQKNNKNEEFKKALQEAGIKNPDKEIKKAQELSIDQLMDEYKVSVSLNISLPEDVIKKLESKRYLSVKKSNGDRGIEITSSGRIPEEVKRDLLALSKEIQDEDNKKKYTKAIEELYKKSQGLRSKLSEAKVIQALLMISVDDEYKDKMKGAITLEELSGNTYGNMRVSRKIIEGKIIPEFQKQDKNLKIHVVTDGFHRLRSLLVALDLLLRKDEDGKANNWLINAEALYNPANFETEASFQEMNVLELAGYLKHMIGNPYHEVDPETTSAWGEIERMVYRDLPDFMNDGNLSQNLKTLMGDFRVFLKQQWEVDDSGLRQSSHLIKLRAQLRQFLEAVAEGNYQKFNEDLLEARIAVVLKSWKDKLTNKGLSLDGIYTQAYANEEWQKEMVKTILKSKDFATIVFGQGKELDIKNGTRVYLRNSP